MGLFVRPFGGTVFLAPPLIFTKEQADRTVEVLDAAVTGVEARLQSSLRGEVGAAREAVTATR
jgi:adenosylmethionine-8-amino-7-oxononanoate aminotransferase